MTGIDPLPRTALCLLACCVLIGAGAASGAEPLAEGRIRSVCSDADGSKHPKKAVIEQLVRREPPAGAGATIFLINYDSTQEGEPRAGVVKTKIKLVRDGRSDKLASFKMKTDPQTGEATAVRVEPQALAPGDVVRWELKFRKFNSLRRDKCFVLLTTVAAESAP